ncbi:hypothetical protein QT383_19660 [Stenotrophomonas rhizophila]
MGFANRAPERYQYSFGQLADNTHALLQQLQLRRAVHVVGHSDGRHAGHPLCALMYPQELRSLSLVNPIGLRTGRRWACPGAAWDAWYAGEMNISYDSIRRYQLDVYYDGKWKPAYEPWARMQSGMYEAGSSRSPGASVDLDMVFNQPCRP